VETLWCAVVIQRNLLSFCQSSIGIRSLDELPGDIPATETVGAEITHSCDRRDGHNTCGEKIQQYDYDEQELLGLK